MNKHMSAEHRNGKGGFDCPIPECNSTFQKVTFLIRHHRSVLSNIEPGIQCQCDYNATAFS